jgi:hypothetical protein
MVQPDPRRKPVLEMFSDRVLKQVGEVCRAYGIFTSGAYGATAPDAAFPQEKTHFAVLSCSE